MSWPESMENSKLYEMRNIYFNGYRAKAGVSQEATAEAYAAAKKEFPDPEPKPRMLWPDGTKGTAWRVVNGTLQNNAASGEWRDVSSTMSKENLLKFIDLYDNPMDPNP